MENTTPPKPDDGDPFGPPPISTLVCCLHCGREYDSYRIEWRAEPGKRGFWCCPIPGCDGIGFGFDILPVDPDYQDEHGGWVYDDDSDDGEEPEDDARPGADGPTSGDRPPGNDQIPW